MFLLCLVYLGAFGIDFFFFFTCLLLVFIDLRLNLSPVRFLFVLSLSHGCVELIFSLLQVMDQIFFDLILPFGVL